MNRQARQIIKAVQAAGWRVTESKRCWLCWPPSGRRPIPVHRSTAYGRGLRPVCAQLRQEGVII